MRTPLLDTGLTLVAKPCQEEAGAGYWVRFEGEQDPSRHTPFLSSDLTKHSFYLAPYEWDKTISLKAPESFTSTLNLQRPKDNPSYDLQVAVRGEGGAREMLPEMRRLHQSLGGHLYPTGATAHHYFRYGSRRFSQLVKMEINACRWEHSYPILRSMIVNWRWDQYCHFGFRATE